MWETYRINAVNSSIKKEITQPTVHWLFCMALRSCTVGTAIKEETPALPPLYHTVRRHLLIFHMELGVGLTACSIMQFHAVPHALPHEMSPKCHTKCHVQCHTHCHAVPPCWHCRLGITEISS